MSRNVKAAIVQMANKLHGDESVEAHRKAMIEAHIPYITCLLYTTDAADEVSPV